MKLVSKIILIVAFSCGLLAYNLRFWLWENAFYHLIALEFVLLYIIIWNEAKSKWWKVISWIMAWTCIDSFVDEFIDPTKFSVNEYIGFLIIVIFGFLYERLFRVLR